ncbi:MAG: adenylate/guanylate cyclase domain-containing protein [Mariprofundus sp.]
MSLRWVWSLLAVVVVVIVGAVMMFTISEIEHRAWYNSEQGQSALLTRLLADELKMPMMADSRAEVDTLVKAFLQRLPGSTVYLKWGDNEESFGDQSLPVSMSAMHAWPVKPAAMQGDNQWHALDIRYNTTSLGHLALYNPGKVWAEYATQIQRRLAIALAITAFVTGGLVFLLSGSVRDYLRLLARASKAVGGGDFSVQLPIRSGNEFGRAFYQFNQMVSRLESREKMYDLYGHFQRPELVAEVYDHKSRSADQQQEVSVLTVRFTGYDSMPVSVVPDDALYALNRMISLIKYIAQEFGGHVEHYSAEEMVLVFNHPLELKCHQNQAVKAGIAIAAAVTGLSETESGGVIGGCRIGFATGDVVVGYLGTGRHRHLVVAGAPILLATQLARSVDRDGVIAPYGTMLVLGHGFRPQEMDACLLPDGTQLRCIQVLAGERYVEEEVNSVVDKAYQRFNPSSKADDDDQW